MAKEKKPKEKLTFAEAAKRIAANVEKADGNKLFGTGTYEYAPTRLLRLGMYLGGGLPLRAIYEIFGPEGGYKSTLSYMMLADVQAHCKGRSVADDNEHMFVREYAAQQGWNVDIAGHELIQPLYLEQGFNALRHFVETGEVTQALVDSIASIATKAEIESEVEKRNVGVRAMAVTQFLYRIVPLIDQFGCTLFCINQVRVQIGQLFGDPETTPGGKALRHLASVRIRCSKKEDETGKQLVTIKVIKNKFTGKNVVLQYSAIAGKGLELTYELLDYAVDVGLVRQEGAYYKFGTKVSKHGRDKAAEFINSKAAEFRPLADEKAAALISGWRGAVEASD